MLASVTRSQENGLPFDEVSRVRLAHTLVVVMAHTLDFVFADVDERRWIDGNTLEVVDHLDALSNPP